MHSFLRLELLQRVINRSKIQNDRPSIDLFSLGKLFTVGAEMNKTIPRLVLIDGFLLDFGSILSLEHTITEPALQKKIVISFILASTSPE